MTAAAIPPIYNQSTIHNPGQILSDNGEFFTDGQGNLSCGNIIADNIFFDSSTVVDVIALGADSTGVNDATAIFQKAAASLPNGGTFIVDDGTFLLSAPTVIATQGINIVGRGKTSHIRPAPSFVGAAVFLIQADFCQIHDLFADYLSTTPGSNPAADFVQFNGSKHSKAWNLDAYYFNGYVVNSLASSSSSNASLILQNIHGFQNVSGIQIKGHTNQNFLAQHKLINVDMEQVIGGNAFDFIDCADVTATNILGATNAATGVTLNIQGKVSSLFLSDFDLGSIGGQQPVCKIQTGSSGNPKGMTLCNGILQQGSTSIDGSVGSNLTFVGVQLCRNQGHGVSLSGSISSFIFDDCQFFNNGQSAGTWYEIQSSTTGQGEIQNSGFYTAFTAIAAVLNVTAGDIEVRGGVHFGTGHSASNFYAGAPSRIFNVHNYNDILGVFSTPAQPSVPATTVASTTVPFDCYVYVTGGTVTDIKPNNQSLGGLTTPATVFVHAGQPLVWVGTGAPTWKWQAAA